MSEKEVKIDFAEYLNCNKYIINVSSSHLATISKLIQDQESTYRMIGLRTKTDENFSDSLEHLRKHLENNTKLQPTLSPETIEVIKEIFEANIETIEESKNMSKYKKQIFLTRFKQAQEEFTSVYGGSK